MSKKPIDKTKPPYAGPIRECCGQPTIWYVQGGVWETCEVPKRNPPTFFAAGPWQCTVNPAHRGPWIHTTTDPMQYCTCSTCKVRRLD